MWKANIPVVKAIVSLAVNFLPRQSIRCGHVITELIITLWWQ